MAKWYPCCGEDGPVCACCSGTVPSTVSVTISGVGGGAGGICTNANGTYVLTGSLVENCNYSYDQWIVDPFRLRVWVTAGFTCSGSDTIISVSFTVGDSAGSKTTGWTWTKTISGKPIDCAAERTSFTESGVTTGIFGDACDTTFPTMVFN